VRKQIGVRGRTVFSQKVLLWDFDGILGFRIGGMSARVGYEKLRPEIYKMDLTLLL
jgi:hypothetical protein